MKVSIIEMIGLLQGKCLPRNIKVNESLAAYLVRQFEELYSERDALQEQVQKLGSEAIQLREYVEKECYIQEIGSGFMAEADVCASERMPSTPATDAVIREIGAKAVADSDDKNRMDWLCAHCVEVRSPRMYGSHAMFHAKQDSEEWDLPHHTMLREQVDAAIRAGEQS